MRYVYILFTNVLVSMIHNQYTKEKNGTESVIVDSVRAQIINHLKDGKPARFKDIKTKLHKHDYVIKRELDILKDKGWVIKTGSGHTTRYSLNLEMKALTDFLNMLAATPNINNSFYPIALDMSFLADVLREAIPTEDESIKETNIIEIVKMMETEIALPNIEITIAGNKITNFDIVCKLIESQTDMISSVVRFMKFVNEMRGFTVLANITDSKKDTTFDEVEKSLTETLNQEFKVIISWKPTQEINFREVCKNLIEMGIELPPPLNEC